MRRAGTALSNSELHDRRRTHNRRHAPLRTSRMVAARAVAARGFCACNAANSRRPGVSMAAARWHFSGRRTANLSHKQAALSCRCVQRCRHDAGTHCNSRSNDDGLQTTGLLAGTKPEKVRGDRHELKRKGGATPAILVRGSWEPSWAKVGDDP